MSDINIVLELINRLDFTNTERLELITALLKDIIEYQDWGYGCDEMIKNHLKNYYFSQIKEIMDSV